MPDPHVLQVISTMMQWVIAPVAAFVWIIYRQQNKHDTDIAVLKTAVDAMQRMHANEIREIREANRSIIAKLNSIEEALRK